MQTLSGRVVLVTGASRGVGRGVASALADAGATVYAAGRQVQSADLPESVRRETCDATDDAALDRVFDGIAAREGRLDGLVNASWGGYERMVENGAFTWPLPFWSQPRWRWDAMMTTGVRAAFIASQRAAQLMIPNGRGLIVNVSHWAAQKYIGNVLYGISKAATDKMTADCAHELKDFGITVVSLYPGLVRTELVLAAGVFDLSNSESPEFQGRAVGALLRDEHAQRWTGHVVLTAALGLEYGFTDEDGAQPRPLSIAEA